MTHQTLHLIEYEDEMKRNAIVVSATWDDGAGVWVAKTDNLEGLAVEAETLDELAKEVLAMIPELIEVNGLKSELAEVPVHIVTVHKNRVVDPVE